MKEVWETECFESRHRDPDAEMQQMPLQFFAVLHKAFMSFHEKAVDVSAATARAVDAEPGTRDEEPPQP
jgi:hypothetical protein